MKSCKRAPRTPAFSPFHLYLAQLIESICIDRRTHCSFTMSSTVCTVVPAALPVKSNRTPSDVIRRLFLENIVMSMPYATFSLENLHRRQKFHKTFSDGYTDILAECLVENRDIDVGREVFPCIVSSKVRMPAPK